jgi:crotonobetainyl-CoA:carnitine CoA-transferase CaiB-like acyl-CoA transferase
VFLACPQDDEWPDLCRALAGVTDLTADARFATADARRTQDDALAAVLAAAFRTRPATSGGQRTEVASDTTKRARRVTRGGARCVSATRRGVAPTLRSSGRAFL